MTLEELTAKVLEMDKDMDSLIKSVRETVSKMQKIVELGSHTQGHLNALTMKVNELTD